VYGRYVISTSRIFEISILCQEKFYIALVHIKSIQNFLFDVGKGLRPQKSTSCTIFNLNHQAVTRATPYHSKHSISCNFVKSTKITEHTVICWPFSSYNVLLEYAKLMIWGRISSFVSGYRGDILTPHKRKSESRGRHCITHLKLLALSS